MTVKQLYNMSCRLIYETPGDDDDLKDTFPHVLSQVLAEAVGYENMFRRVEKRSLLTVVEIPLYESADDETELPFTEILCRAALPLGIKARLLEEDGSKQAEGVMAYNQYTQALNDLTPAAFIQIERADDETD